MSESQYPSDVQFAGLVQAATDAAGQEQLWSSNSHGTHPEKSSYPPEPSLNPSSQTPRKRKRGQSEILPQGQYTPVAHSADDRAVATLPETPSQDGVSRDGVASALFREPSEKSRRYTRPPMSSLYSSLQLAPEHFLRLQTSAKDYMLDENFPERQDCVGQRGAGDNSDMVKLKLWNCVQEFLDQHGNGEKYWGHQVGSIADQASRTVFWPEDSQQIVKLCIPLLRRMVTNERQRKYAAVARKTGDKGKTSRSSDVHDDSMIGTADSSPRDSPQLPGSDARDLPSEGPELRTTRFRSESQTRTVVEPPLGSNAAPTSQTLKQSANAKAPTSASRPSDTASNGARSGITLLVNLISKGSSASSGPPGRRLIPQFSLPPESAANLASLHAEIQQRYYAVSPALANGEIGSSIKVWLPDGLVEIKDDGQWMVALLSAGMVEWMDSEVRIIVEL